MDIDPKSPICGVQPAALKRLFRRTHLTISATMAVLVLDRPSATATLAALEGEGWLERDGAQWVLTDQGLRLMATKLHPRRPVESANDALARLLAEVTAINDDPSHSYWVNTIYLFGSMLTAKPGETVGDIDIAVELKRRPEDEAALMAELRSAPSSHRGVQVWTWPADRAKRRLRKVDRCFSVHPLEDALTSEHRIIFQRQET